MPRTMTTTSGMSVAETMAWWTAIVFTCGIAYPFYLGRKHKANRTSVTVIE